MGTVTACLIRCHAKKLKKVPSLNNPNLSLTDLLFVIDLSGSNFEKCCALCLFIF